MFLFFRFWFSRFGLRFNGLNRPCQPPATAREQPGNKQDDQRKEEKLPQESEGRKESKISHGEDARSNSAIEASIEPFTPSLPG